MSSPAPTRRYRYLLSAYLRPQGRRVALLGVLMLATLGLELANPWILREFFSRLVVQIFGNASLLVGVLALMYTIDWRVGLAMSVFVLITLGLINKMRDLSVPHWRLARQASADLFGFIEERLSGTEDIRSSGATAYTMRRLHERSRDLLRRERRAAVVGSTSGGVAGIMFTLGTAIALGLGVV